jgi:hypothetical protein
MRRRGFFFFFFHFFDRLVSCRRRILAVSLASGAAKKARDAQVGRLGPRWVRPGRSLAVAVLLLGGELHLGVHLPPARVVGQLCGVRPGPVQASQIPSSQNSSGDLLRKGWLSTS